jgi:hypothetical protein
MSDNAFWAIIICALMVSCQTEEAIRAYREVNKPLAIETVRPTP